MLIVRPAVRGQRSAVSGQRAAAEAPQPGGKDTVSLFAVARVGSIAAAKIAARGDNQRSNPLELARAKPWASHRMSNLVLRLSVCSLKRLP